MWLTPTYHLFHLYAPHRSAAAVRTEFESVESRGALALLSASASKKGEQLFVSLSNRSKDDAQEVTLDLRGGTLHGGTVRTLSGAPDAHNSAEEPDAVGVTEAVLEASGSTIMLTLPPCSVQTFTLKLA